MWTLQCANPDLGSNALRGTPFLVFFVPIFHSIKKFSMLMCKHFSDEKYWEHHFFLRRSPEFFSLGMPLCFYFIRAWMHNRWSWKLGKNTLRYFQTWKLCEFCNLHESFCRSTVCTRAHPTSRNVLDEQKFCIHGWNKNLKPDDVSGIVQGSKFLDSLETYLDWTEWTCIHMRWNLGRW